MSHRYVYNECSLYICAGLEWALESTFWFSSVRVQRSADEELLSANSAPNLHPAAAIKMLAPVADFNTVTKITRIGRLRIDTRGPVLLSGLRCPIQTSRSVHLSCQVDLRNVAVNCVRSQFGRHATSRPLSTSRTCGQIRAISSSVSTDSGSATPSREVR